VQTAGDTLTVQLTVSDACLEINEIDFVSSGLASIDAVGSWVAPMDVFEGGSPGAPGNEVKWMASALLLFRG
jgi:hypothetical protein